jgi:hypothetical protein
MAAFLKIVSGIHLGFVWFVAFIAISVPPPVAASIGSGNARSGDNNSDRGRAIDSGGGSFRIRPGGRRCPGHTKQRPTTKRPFAGGEIVLRTRATSALGMTALSGFGV